MAIEDPKLNASAYTPGIDSGINTQGTLETNPQYGLLKQPKSEVAMVDPSKAINQINSQNDYLNKTYPQETKPTGQKPVEKPAEPVGGVATYTNANGQEFSYNQSQLDDPTIQNQIASEGLTLMKADAGLNLSGIKKAGEYNQAADDVANLTKDFLSYNVDKDPAFQAQAQNIKDKFSRLSAEMEKTNQQRQRGFETLGMRGGTTQYGGAIQMGIEGEELKQGSQRLADLTSQEAEAISAARTAYETGKYNQFNVKVNALKDIREQKAKELESYNKAITDAIKKVQDQQQSQLTQLQIQKAQQDIVKTNLDSYASGFVDFNENGDVTTADPEQLRKFSEESGIPYEQIVGAVRNKAYELGKLSAEDRKRELDIQNAQRQLIPQLFQEYNYAQDNLGYKGSWQDFLASKKESDTTLPTSYKEWQLAGGMGGTGKTYADYLKKTVGDGLTTQQASNFNNIVNKYQTSPLVKANDRTLILKTVSDKLEKDPTNASLQVSFIYSMIQALDTYQSSVREGEIGLIGSTQGVADKIKNLPDKIQKGSVLSTDKVNEYLKTAKSLTDAIGSAAKAKQQQFASQANVSGVGDAWNEYIKGSQVATPQYATLEEFSKYGTPEEKGALNNLRATFPDKTPQEVFDFYLEEQGKNKPLSVGNSTQALALSVPDGSKGGECGHFVNQLTGLGLGDSYESKMAKMDKGVTPQPGMVFVMPYKDTGHTGFILAINNGIATVKDSNYHSVKGSPNYDPHKVYTHTIPVSKMTGFKQV